MIRFFLLAILSFLILSCESENDTSSERDPFRLSHFTNIDKEGLEYIKTEFHYSNNNLSQITISVKTDNQEWVAQVKHLFEYSEDLIIETVQRLSGEEWYSWQKIERKLEGNKVVELIEYDISFEGLIPSSKIFYNYKAGILISWTESEYNNGSFIESKKGEVERSGEMIKETIYSRVSNGKVTPYEKGVPQYSGTSMINCVYYSFDQDSWKEYTKWEFAYSSDLIENVEIMKWNDLESSWEDLIAFTYTYNNQGLIGSFKSDGSSVVYVYEEGESNNALIMKSPKYLFDIRPNPY